MNPQLINLSQRYVTALRKHLELEPGTNFAPALELGRRAVALGLETLELARIHERALTALNLSGGPSRLTKRAANFFSETIAPILETHPVAQQNRKDLARVNKLLIHRTANLAAINLQLQRGVVERKNVEAAHKKSDEYNTQLLKESLQLQEGLRQMTHRVLAAQEDERKKISRELQNEIAQTLLGINVRLLSLNQEAQSNNQGIRQEIASTQRLVAKSAKTVRRVAREFRNP